MLPNEICGKGKDKKIKNKIHNTERGRRQKKDGNKITLRTADK